jgi:hypothetical protein
MESEPPAEGPLVCSECGRESEPDAAGWRAYLDDDDQAVAFCRERAERKLTFPRSTMVGLLR